MSNNEHPITPPDELVKQWQASLDCPDNSCAQAKYIATQAARWGADIELDACCEWTVRNYIYPEAANPLRAARRPKALSNKQQSIALIHKIQGGEKPWNIRDLDVVLRALEALPE